MGIKTSLLGKTESQFFINDNLPLEKLKRAGVSSLSDADLFAILLRSGTKDSDVFSVVNSLLRSFDYKEQGIAGFIGIDFEKLTELKGIGEVKAAQLLAVSELCKRIRACPLKKKISISDVRSVAECYMDYFRSLDREHVVIVYLDNKLRIIGDEVISIGTINLSILSSREIFSRCLRKNAVSFILLHNHPSGDASPSPEDIKVTKLIKEGAKLLGLNFTDHCVIGDNCFFSLKEHGYI